MIETYFKNIKAELKGFLQKKTGDPEVAEDLVQDTFVKVLKAGKRDTLDKPRAYFFSAARSVLVDYYRKVRTQQESHLLFLEEIEDETLAVSSERHLESREDLRILETAISKLPPRAQKAFVLNRIYRFTYGEVSKMMGISPRTVENHVARGLAYCADEIAAAHQLPSEESVVAFPQRRKRGAKND